ncbi:MAG: transposase [Bacteroidetes bacterium]|nr:transposase [Bacteroidota bacterium]
MAIFIRYQTKQGKTYAQLMDALRVDGKKRNRYVANLGIVLDKNRGVFKSKERGVYLFTLDGGYADAPAEVEILHSNAKKERLILDFGDSFMLDRYLRDNTPFSDLFDDILPNQRDTLLSLIYYRLLTDRKAYLYAQPWHEGNYASILYPKARLQSQRISDFLVALGSEEVGRDFFSSYLGMLYAGKESTGILIDSTGLHNAVDMPLTALSNHNGDINFEMRLIYVIDRISGMPLYLRYCAGNVLDISTLRTTVEELKQLGVKTDFALVDAGYYSNDNVDALYADDIAFVSRVGTNRKLFKGLVDKHAKSLRQAKYMVPFGNRVVYMRRFPVDLHGHAGYAYLGLDMDSHNMQEKKISLQALNDKLSFEDIDSKMRKLGSFVIVSSNKMDCKDILPLYYTRVQVEQVFDIAKNNADLVPLRIQGEKTLRGHLMLTFLATILFQLLQKDLLLHTQKKDKINPEGSFLVLRNQKCKVYDGVVIPQEPTKRMNDIYKLLKIQSPFSIPYQRY